MTSHAEWKNKLVSSVGSKYKQKIRRSILQRN